MAEPPLPQKLELGASDLRLVLAAVMPVELSLQRRGSRVGRYHGGPV